jgi:hypothetical protein
MAYSVFFTVLKASINKVSLRTIFHTKGINVGGSHAPPVNLSSFPEWLAEFKDAEYLWTTDMRHFFHQFGLAEDIRKYFTVLCRGNRFRCACLPMGWTWSPFIAQSLAWWLAVGDESFEWQELPRVYTHNQVKIIIWYDNLLFGGKKADVMKLREAFLARTVWINGTIKEESNSDEGPVTFVGVDLRPATPDKRIQWGLAQKTKSKLMKHLEMFRAEREISKKKWETIRGQIVWSFWALQQNFFALTPLFKWKTLETRRYSEVIIIIEEIMQHEWEEMSANKEPFSIFCDASTKGWGAVTRDGVEFSGKFRQLFTSADMFYLEAIAVKQAVMSAPNDRAIGIVTDNMALMHSINRGATACPRTARVLQEAYIIMRNKGCTWTATYIGTKENPADNPSRGKPVNRNKLTAANKSLFGTL